MIYSRRFLVAVCSALLLGLVPAQAKVPAGVTQVRTVEGVAEYRLANGGPYFCLDRRRRCG